MVAELTLLVLFGVALGASAAWAWLRPRVRSLQQACEATSAERGALEEELRTGQAELVGLRERLAARAELDRQLEDRFRALSGEALDRNNTSFLELARREFEQLHVRSSEELRRREQAVEHLVTPIRESLERVGNEVKTLESARRQDHGELTAQLRLLGETNERLRSETGSLVTALRSPSVRGRWGEMQLRRAVEVAGMLEYCDFVEQTSSSEGSLRPDLVVKLPGGRNLVVDAKVPLQALLDAHDATEEAAQAAAMRDFSRHVRMHVTKLSAKAYWTQFAPAPDFVIMFLPGEGFYRTALEQDSSLLEFTANERVVVASPSTLIAMLRAVAVGWREERVAESARAVNDLGRELYERLAVMIEHFIRVGKGLEGAVQSYNQTVGSLERRVLPSARRFLDHGIGSAKELPAVTAIERAPQPPQTIELPQRGRSAEGDPEPNQAIDAA